MDGCKLSPKGLGLSLGVIWGVFVLVMGLFAYAYVSGKPFVDAMATLYMGYEPTIPGSIIGGIIGFIYAYVAGYLVAYLYNVFSCCSCCCCGGKEVKETQEPKTTRATRAAKKTSE